MHDLVSLGEVMLRLSPPKFQRLRRMTQLDVHVAGSQLNVAANLARLGRRTAFLSKLPDNELGLLARDVCESYGVDMSAVIMVTGARMGVNYVEFSVAPRTGVAVYDRAGSAASTIAPDDFDWDEVVKDTTLAYTDGIFPGLSLSCADAALAFLTAARRAGCTTCFDVNYREHLWTETRAKAAWTPLLKQVDIVTTNRAVSEAVFGYRGSDEEMMQQYHDHFGCQVVCFTSREMIGVLHGAWSSKAFSDGRIQHGRRFEFDVIDRFGAGDAWFAGFLYGYLESGIERGLTFGDAYCALAHTVEGDIGHVSSREVDHLIATEGRDLRVRR